MSCSTLARNRNTTVVRWAAAGFALLAGGLVVWSYLAPWGFSALFGLDHSLPTLFAARLLGGRPPSLPAWLYSAGGLVLVGGQWACYGLALWRSRRPSGHPMSLELLILPLVIGMAYVCVPPLFSTDVGTYALQARVWTVFGQNPYTTAPLPLDPSFLFRPWTRAFVYGPVSLLTTAGVVRVAGPDLFAEIVGLKVLGLVLHLASTYTVFRIAARVRPGSEQFALVCYGWNPLVLLEMVGSAHNDGLMVLFMLLALWCYVLGSRWRWAGWALVMMAVLVKYAALPFALFYLTAWLREQHDERGLAGMGATLSLGGVLAGGMLLGVASVLPPGSLLGLWHGLGEESSFVRLSVGWFLPIKASWAFLKSVCTPSAQIYSQGARLVGIVAQVFGCALILGQAGWLYRENGGVAGLLRAWGIFILLTLAVLSPSIFPWYFCWLLAPLAAVEESKPQDLRRLLVATLILCGIMMGLYFIPVRLE